MIKETAYDVVFDAQRHFRTLLDCMARPGTVGRLDDVAVTPPGLNRASALAGFALLNADVSYHIEVSGADLPLYITMNTASQQAELHEADFLFVRGDKAADTVSRAKIGTLTYPENGATVIVDVDRVAAVPFDGARAFSLQGPGVDGEVTVYVAGLEEGFATALKEKNEEFPLGVDAILTDTAGAVVCISRTSKIDW